MRNCPPSPISLPVQQGTAIQLDLEMQGLAEENTNLTNTPHETQPGALLFVNLNENDGDSEKVDKDPLV
jgi:hypothetical protein